MSLKKNPPKMIKAALNAVSSKTINCGKVEIKDKGNTPFTTTISVDGKPLEEIYILKSLTYKVNVQTGLSSLTITYHPRQE